MADLLGIVWRRLYLITLVAVSLTVLVVGFTLAQPPTYEATTKIIVGQEGEIAATPAESGGLVQVTGTMAEALNSRSIAAAAIEDLNLKTSPEALLANLTVEQLGETQFIMVRYRNTSPEKAQKILQSIGQVFSQQVSADNPDDGAITATVWDSAAVATGPVSPTPLRNMVLALSLGLALGVGLAFLLEYLKTSGQTPLTKWR